MSKSTAIQCSDLPINGKTSHHQHQHPSPSSPFEPPLAPPPSQYGRNSTFNPSSRKLQHQHSCISLSPSSDSIRRQKYALSKCNNPAFSQSVPHISSSNSSSTVSTSTCTGSKKSSPCCTYCSDCCNGSLHSNINNNNNNHSSNNNHILKSNAGKSYHQQHVFPPSSSTSSSSCKQQGSSPSAGIYYASNGVTVGNNYINCHSNSSKRYQQQKYLIHLQHAQAAPGLQAILLAPTTTKFSPSANANYTGFSGGGTINNGGHGYSSHQQVTFSPAWPTLPRSNSNTSSSHGHCHRNCHHLPCHPHLSPSCNHQSSNQLTNLPSHSLTQGKRSTSSSKSSPSPPQFTSSSTTSPSSSQKAQCHCYYTHPSVSFNPYECQEHSSPQCNSKFHQINLHNQHHQQKQVNGQSLQWHSNQQVPATANSSNRQVLQNNAITSTKSNTGKYTLPPPPPCHPPPPPPPILSTFSGKDKSSPTSSKPTASTSVKRCSVTFDTSTTKLPVTMDTYTDSQCCNGAIVSAVDYDGNSTGSNTSNSSGIGSASNYSCTGSNSVPSTASSNCTEDNLTICNKSKVRSSISSGDSSNSSSLAPVSERSSDSEYSTDGQGKLDQDLTYGPLDELDVTQYLIYNSPYENGYEIKGGNVDALIVKATEVSGNDFLFQEAFLTTYRTFISPKMLIEKLVYRFNKFIMMEPMNHGPCPYSVNGKRLSGYSFSSSSNHYGSTDSLYHPSLHQKAARAASSLIARVVNDLCVTECTDSLMNSVEAFILHLDELHDEMARVLRSIINEKKKIRKAHLEPTKILLPSVAISTKVKTLFDFKSEELAEQITLLDSELFSKIEVAEALMSAKDPKNISNIPNLAKFTEHFNNKSYWIRTRILQEEDSSERKRIITKFIKIMRALKKLKNFNSIFAILSALDSAPIKRLDWPKGVLEELKEFEQLSDSSSSFHCYRTALADAEPPCVPYVGLILQDLTFVHVGNDDYLDSNGNVNFTKCWLQFDILVQMRRFRNCHYRFNRNEEIIGFFANFEDYLHEESLWQISESLKPRGKRPS